MRDIKDAIKDKTFNITISDSLILNLESNVKQFSVFSLIAKQLTSAGINTHGIEENVGVIVEEVKNLLVKVKALKAENDNIKKENDKIVESDKPGNTSNPK